MSFESPFTVLYNTEGIELAVSTSQNLTGSGEQPGILLAGSSSSGQARLVKVTDAGEVFVTGALSLAPGTSVDQGSHGTPDESWYTVLTDGTSSTALGSAEASPLFISGTVATNGPDGTLGDPVFVTGSVLIGEQPIEVTGSVEVQFDPSPSTTVSGTNATDSTITLLAANVNRRGALFYYDGSKILYLKLGTGASLTDFSVKIPAQGFYELPAGYNYTGPITAIWNSTAGGAGFVQTTEILN